MGLPDVSQLPDLVQVEPSVYDLTVISARMKTSERTGREALSCSLSIDSVPNSETIYHDCWLPMEGDEDRPRDTMLRSYKKFIEACGHPNLTDPVMLIGAKLRAFVKIEQVTDSDNNPTGQTRNAIGRFEK